MAKYFFKDKVEVVAFINQGNINVKEDKFRASNKSASWTSSSRFGRRGRYLGQGPTPGPTSNTMVLQ
eukprot:471618-Prorocentrum_lima.AAC.1